MVGALQFENGWCGNGFCFLSRFKCAAREFRVIRPHFWIDSLTDAICGHIFIYFANLINVTIPPRLPLSLIHSKNIYEM